MEQHNAERGATGDEPEAPNHSPDDEQGSEPATEDLTARVQELEERAQRYMANWQRAQADLQNFRKQVERDQEEMAQWATAALMQQILSVLDDFERAFGSVPANLLSLTWIEGVWLVYKKLESHLVARGLEGLEVEPGQQFDPRQHQAVSDVDGEAGCGGGGRAARLHRRRAAPSAGAGDGGQRQRRGHRGDGCSIAGGCQRRRGRRKHRRRSDSGGWGGHGP